MDEALRHRYARHIALAEIGADGQRRISEATVFIVGMGGLGCAAAQYLAAAGVGTLLLNDFDSVDATNLQRQVLHHDADVGEAKVDSAAAEIGRINPHVLTRTLRDRLDAETLAAELEDMDVVLDGTDNFGTRFLVNEASVTAGTPLVSGAAIRWQGQLAVFDPRLPEGPCYACLFGEGDEVLEDCAGEGVLAPLVGVVGAGMAVEALKVILDRHGPGLGRLWRYDALSGAWQESRFAREPACPVCGENP